MSATAAKRDAKNYPRLTALGVAILRTHADCLPGINGEEFRRKLTVEQRHRWHAWANGITCGPNGVYPWDAERFLEGLPNDD